MGSPGGRGEQSWAGLLETPAGLDTGCASIRSGRDVARFHIATGNATFISHNAQTPMPARADTDMISRDEVGMRTRPPKGHAVDLGDAAITEPLGDVVSPWERQRRPITSCRCPGPARAGRC